jgi:hypothetical protein
MQPLGLSREGERLREPSHPYESGHPGPLPLLGNHFGARFFVGAASDTRHFKTVNKTTKESK